MKTYTAKASEIDRAWHVIDATGQPLGRLASRVAMLLRGKHKPIYSPHLDTGDYVVIVNASQVAFTGQKVNQKVYYHHSMYPGGLKAIRLKEMLQRHPERVIERAVRGMLPKGALGKQIATKLRVYVGSSHPHIAQVNAGAAQQRRAARAAAQPLAPEPPGVPEEQPAMAADASSALADESSEMAGEQPQRVEAEPKTDEEA